MSDAAPIEHPTGLTGGDFTEADEPLRLFADWFAEAKRAEPVNPDAMALATVDADGLPNARMVLLKGFDERGFVFYTNIDSVKGHELDGRAEGGADVLLEVAAAPGARARQRGSGVEGRGRRLFRHALAHGADRRLGQQAIVGAGKPPGVREGDRALHREIRDRHGAAAAVLVGLSRRAAGDRVLAGAAVPAARPHRVSRARA